MHTPSHTRPGRAVSVTGLTWPAWHPGTTSKEGSGGVLGYSGMRLTFLPGFSRQDLTCQPHPPSLVAERIKDCSVLTPPSAALPPPAFPVLAPLPLGWPRTFPSREWARCEEGRNGPRPVVPAPPPAPPPSPQDDDPGVPGSFTGQSLGMAAASNTFLWSRL